MSNSTAQIRKLRGAASEFLNNGLVEEAHTLALSLLHVRPTDPEEYKKQKVRSLLDYTSGCVESQLGNEEEALAYWHQALKGNPGNPFIYAFLLMVYRRRQEWSHYWWYKVYFCLNIGRIILCLLTDQEIREATQRKGREMGYGLTD